MSIPLNKPRTPQFVLQQEVNFGTIPDIYPTYKCIMKNKNHSMCYLYIYPSLVSICYHPVKMIPIAIIHDTTRFVKKPPNWV